MDINLSKGGGNLQLPWCDPPKWARPAAKRKEVGTQTAPRMSRLTLVLDAACQVATRFLLFKALNGGRAVKCGRPTGLGQLTGRASVPALPSHAQNHDHVLEVPPSKQRWSLLAHGIALPNPSATIATDPSLQH
jgi:hypothetical protein